MKRTPRVFVTSRAGEGCYKTFGVLLLLLLLLKIGRVTIIYEAVKRYRDITERTFGYVYDFISCIAESSFLFLLR